MLPRSQRRSGDCREWLAPDDRQEIHHAWGQKEAPPNRETSVGRVVCRTQQEADKRARHQSTEHRQNGSFNPTPETELLACRADHKSGERYTQQDQ